MEGGVVSDILKVHKKSIDLETVAEMDEDEYNATYRYVSQWDNAEWTNALHKARTGEDAAVVEPEPELEEEPERDAIDKMTVEELKAELALKDLPLSGHKADLVARLREAGGVEE